MPVALLNLCSFLMMLSVESLSACEVSVHIINLGCHLEWYCPNANPKTTYTVSAKTNGIWKKVSDCIQISRQSCNLSQVFPNLHISNFINLRSEELPWLNETLHCDSINDATAEFSPPSTTIFMNNDSLWVTVHFPCAPSISCTDSGAEEGCVCPVNEFQTLVITVKLYNTQNLSDIQTRTGEVDENYPFKVEFGFLTPGQEYCAVANFTAKTVSVSSPASLPLCYYIPAKTESLVVMIVCAVLITLGLVICLLWRLSASSERPLPRPLALLQDLELHKETLIDLSQAQPHNEISDGDHISIVSVCGFTLVDNQSYFQNSQSLGNGYYTSPILHNPDCSEESEESGELEVQHHELHLFPSHSGLEAELGCPYQNQCEESLNIPLSTVRVKQIQQEETSIDDLEQCGDMNFETEY